MSAYIPVPQSSTVGISASTTSSNTWLNVGSSNMITQILVTNVDANNTVFVNWNIQGNTSTATTSGFPVPPYYPAVIQVNQPNNFVSNINISAITTTGTAQVYFTPITGFNT